MAAQLDDDERPTESTPLIFRRSTVQSQLSPASSLLPSLIPAQPSTTFGFMAFKRWTRTHPFSPPHTLPVSLSKSPLRSSCSRSCTFYSRHLRSVLVWMFGNSGPGNAGRLSTLRIYKDALLVSGRGFLKSVETHRRSRNVSGLHSRWKRGNLSLSGVGPCFSVPEGVYLIILIQHSCLPFHLSRRYLEGSRRASLPRVSSSDSPELVAHLDSWKSLHSCRIFIPSYPATLSFRGNPEVC